MKRYTVTERPLPDEREMTINLHLNDNGEWEWEVETNISKYINLFKKRGWEQLTEHTLKSDDTVQSATFSTTTKKPISFRDLSKVGSKRVMSEEQKAKLREGLLKSKLQNNSQNNTE